jgi:hypothetical protein
MSCSFLTVKLEESILKAGQGEPEVEHDVVFNETVLGLGLNLPVAAVQAR